MLTDDAPASNQVVRAIFDKNIPTNPKDFGLIGNLAVSEFEGHFQTPGRALRESFSVEKIELCSRHWDDLLNVPETWIARGNGNDERLFMQWARMRAGT